MFLKRHPKRAGGEDYEYWTLARTVRTAHGPRHQTVAHLGKLDEREQRANGWNDLEAMLDGRPVATQPPLPWGDGQGTGIETPLWRRVNVGGVRVERVRQFGRVYLGLALWRRLGLHEVLRMLLPPGQEEIGWDLTRWIGCGRSWRKWINGCGSIRSQPSDRWIVDWDGGWGASRPPVWSSRSNSNTIPNGEPAG